ncbi:hypothetical protein [Clostridium sp.]|uniref:hypothetical protein n=1 Tax=Clostridium sp. TaxID=1506 RepID=UPI003216E9E2
MLNMSFYNGTLNRDKAKEVVNTTNKQLKYRYGYSYRGAEANLISKENALKVIENESLLDINEGEDVIILNVYSSNDMW